MTVPTYTPATYTVPESGVYRSPDGTQNYYWYAGDVISMALAIEMGMPGAAYATASPFTETEEQRIVDLLAEQGGGAVPSQVLTRSDRYYDNRTAAAGVETTYTIFDYTMVGGLIRVEETGKSVYTLGIRVITGAVGATARLSLYGISQSTAQYRGLAGTRLFDAGTVSVATAGYKQLNAGAPVDPGFYWIMVEPSAEITIAGYQAHGNLLGQNTATGAVYSGTSYNPADTMLPHPATIEGGSREPIAPLVIYALGDA